MFMSLPDNCIAVMEDIDVAFSQVAVREGVASGTENGCDELGGKDGPKKEETVSGSRITLSGLLNVLDGVGAKVKLRVLHKLPLFDQIHRKAVLYSRLPTATKS
jgi:hypothetical protein